MAELKRKAARKANDKAAWPSSLYNTRCNDTNRSLCVQPQSTKLHQTWMPSHRRHNPCAHVFMHNRLTDCALKNPACDLREFSAVHDHLRKQQRHSKKNRNPRVYRDSKLRAHLLTCELARSKALQARSRARPLLAHPPDSMDQPGEQASQPTRGQGLPTSTA